jgi:hypothetical protein
VEAAAHAQALWRAGAWDLRALGYLLYGHFLESGMPGLGWLCDAITETFGARWDEIGPAKKKRELGDNTLKWLAQAVLRELMRREKLQDDVWRQWNDDPKATALLDEAIAKGDAAVAALGERLEKGGSVDRFAHLVAWMRERIASLRSESQSRANEAAAAERAAADEAARAVADAERGAAQAEARAAGAGARTTVEGSPAMALLLRKLALFDELIQKDDLRKAAVIAHDVQRTLQQFDPVLFLPKLFVPFFRLLAKQQDLLEPLVAEVESPMTRPLVQLYHADLDAFAES